MLLELKRCGCSVPIKETTVDLVSDRHPPLPLPHKADLAAQFARHPLSPNASIYILWNRFLWRGSLKKRSSAGLLHACVVANYEQMVERRLARKIKRDWGLIREGPCEDLRGCLQNHGGFRLIGVISCETWLDKCRQIPGRCIWRVGTAQHSKRRLFSSFRPLLHSEEAGSVMDVLPAVDPQRWSTSANT